MIDQKSPRCRLCDDDSQPLVKAHIIAKGLLRLNESTGCSFAYIDSSGLTSRRLDGLFLNGVTCRACEDNIFTPLDEYAIQIFRDKIGCEFLGKDGDGDVFFVCNCDRQKLRAYFASLIFRFALGREDLRESRNVEIGEWFDIIRHDLLVWKESKFDYVDAICIEDVSKSAESFSVPRKQYIGVGACSFGFDIDIPHWRFLISLGHKVHPFLKSLFEEGYLMSKTFSLSSETINQPFCYISADAIPERVQRLEGVLADCSLNKHGLNLTKAVVSKI